jgi:hypothetical protein
MTPAPARPLPASILLGVLLSAALPAATARADGKAFAPRAYRGSVEERSQEAVILFSHGPKGDGPAVEDVILKITVEPVPTPAKGRDSAEAKSQPAADPATVDRFVWVVPFPHEPKIAKEDPKLFTELFDYVQARGRRVAAGAKPADEKKSAEKKGDEPPVRVLSRQVVGNFEVAVVREERAGTLGRWLADEGFQGLPAGAAEVVEAYRRKGYVFACVKVAPGAAAESGRPFDAHPLRFTFETGGRDGIYFPMRLTGFQESPVSVNLYVFYGKWLNDSLNRYGYTARGFGRNHRDWDGPQCTPNAGKAWDAPATDPFLKPLAGLIPTVAATMARLHPGERFYLTNISATFSPAEIRGWIDDLWLFPYYVDRDHVPHDARPGGVAAAGYADASDGRGSGPAPAGGPTPVEQSASAPDSADHPAGGLSLLAVYLAVILVSALPTAFILRLGLPRTK